jgi:hypothetical protein
VSRFDCLNPGRRALQCISISLDMITYVAVKHPSMFECGAGIDI